MKNWKQQIASQWRSLPGWFRVGVIVIFGVGLVVGTIQIIIR